MADIFCIGKENGLDSDEIYSMYESYYYQLDLYEAMDFCNRNMAIGFYIMNMITKKELKRFLRYNTH